MDALIFSCGTGGGHNAAGKALLEELQRRGHHAVMMNPYDLKSLRLSGGIDKTYISAVQNVPKAFGTAYKLGNLYRKLPFRSPVYFVNHAMIKTMEEYFSRHHYDVVLMPHLFPAEILTNMKNHGRQIPKTVFVATDYVCIPFTEETACDAYITPAEDLNGDFIRRGIPEEKLYSFGIPTASAFAEALTPLQAQKQLGLDEGKQYILISGGSMGGGKIETAIGKLYAHYANRKDVELLVICGSNRTLYEKLTANHPKERVIGRTDQMALYMKASSLFITKPGGLSSTEAAVCGVPILHTSAIPGCENHNARYFSERGMSMEGELTDEMLLRIDELLSNPSMQDAMVAHQKQFIHPHAAADICDLAQRLCAE